MNYAEKIEIFSVGPKGKKQYDANTFFVMAVLCMFLRVDSCSTNKFNGICHGSLAICGGGGGGWAVGRKHRQDKRQQLMNKTKSN